MFYSCRNISKSLWQYQYIKKNNVKARSGADAIKIQTYEANTITLNSNNNHFMINDSSIWKGKKLYNLYKSAETPFNWHKEIFSFAKKNRILFFCTF